jgi:hypothetical protein
MSYDANQRNPYGQSYPQPQSQPQSEPQSQRQSQPQSQRQSQPQPQWQRQSEPPQSQRQSEPPQSRRQSQAQAESQPQSRMQSQAQAQSQAPSGRQSQRQSQPQPQPQPQSQPQWQSQPQSQPQSQAQPQPSRQPPLMSPPSHRKPKWPWILGGGLLALILAFAGAYVLLFGGTGTPLDQFGNNTNGKEAAEGKLNTPIADGTFEFTVAGMRCGVAQVGDATLNQRAQGQYCLIDLSVKNIGKSAVIFTDISQTAYDAGGNQYSADSGADVRANQDSETFLQQIDPGATVRGRLVFDVPRGVRLTSIVLHESMFSAGAKVPLA